MLSAKEIERAALDELGGEKTAKALRSLEACGLAVRETKLRQRLQDKSVCMVREDSDMNQTQIAEILFTSQTVYSRYERGARTIPVEHLLILADFYGVSTDYILGRTNNKKLNK